MYGDRVNSTREVVAVDQLEVSSPPSDVPIQEADSVADTTPFPRFSAWVISHLTTMTPLNITTLGRYTNGAIPKPLVWFLENPEALMALAEDAQDLSADDLDRIKTMIADRSAAQRDYRQERAAAMEPEPEPEPVKSKRGKK
jgi:hypothetical protein